MADPVVGATQSGSTTKKKKKQGLGGLLSDTASKRFNQAVDLTSRNIIQPVADSLRSQAASDFLTRNTTAGQLASLFAGNPNDVSGALRNTINSAFEPSAPGAPVAPVTQADINRPTTPDVSQQQTPQNPQTPQIPATDHSLVATANQGSGAISGGGPGLGQPQPFDPKSFSRNLQKALGFSDFQLNTDPAAKERFQRASLFAYLADQKRRGALQNQALANQGLLARSTNTPRASRIPGQGNAFDPLSVSGQRKYLGGKDVPIEQAQAAAARAQRIIAGQQDPNLQNTLLAQANKDQLQGTLADAVTPVELFSGLSSHLGGATDAGKVKAALGQAFNSDNPLDALGSTLNLKLSNGNKVIIGGGDSRIGASVVDTTNLDPKTKFVLLEAAKLNSARQKKKALSEQVKK